MHAVHTRSYIYSDVGWMSLVKATLISPRHLHLPLLSSAHWLNNHRALPLYDDVVHVGVSGTV